MGLAVGWLVGDVGPRVGTYEGVLDLRLVGAEEGCVDGRLVGCPEGRSQRG